MKNVLAKINKPTQKERKKKKDRNIGRERESGKDMKNVLPRKEMQGADNDRV